jgi:hypothetical protein
MYTLTINIDCLTTVEINTADFEYATELQKAVVQVREDRDNKARKNLSVMIDKAFNTELTAYRQPAKKRGRPVGSTNKAKKAE